MKAKITYIQETNVTLHGQIVKLIVERPIKAKH